jgi:hypothetical protein
MPGIMAALDHVSPGGIQRMILLATAWGAASAKGVTMVIACAFVMLFAKVMRLVALAAAGDAA